MEHEPADRTRSVVYLETAPRGAFEQVEPGRAVMDQRNETFVPHVLAITTGTVVDFPNSDRIYHNVFSLSKPARFDLGRYDVGRSKSVRFDRPGIVRVFCEIHSHMNAFILVFSHPFFAVTDADGRYRINNVPPGSYTVIAWHEGAPSEPRTAAVPDAGAAEIDFVLP
jgi:plastocyanin